MYESEREQIIAAGMTLDRYRLISLSGGNASMRIGPHVLVTPSGMAYETLVPADVVVMDLEGKVVEGARRPSVDTIALLHIYRNLPAVNAIVHTHQRFATAIGLVMDELPAFCTTMVNATHGPVKVAPYSSAASLDMGVKAVEYLGGSRAVILRNHGVVTVGRHPEGRALRGGLPGGRRRDLPGRALAGRAERSHRGADRGRGGGVPALRAGEAMSATAGTAQPLGLDRPAGEAAARPPGQRWGIYEKALPAGLAWPRLLDAAAAAGYYVRRDLHRRERRAPVAAGAGPRRRGGSSGPRSAPARCPSPPCA